MTLSRRTLFQAGLSVAGASLLPNRASAQTSETPTIVIVNLPGGLHSLGSQADCFVPKNAFSCTATNSRDLGNGVVIDRATFGQLDDSSLSRMCNLGVWHGISAHDLAQHALFIDARKKSYPLQLANSMGGQAPVACALLGLGLAGRHEAIGAASLQKLSDAGGILAALGASPGGEFVPDRRTALAGLRASVRMSAPTLTKNQRSLASMTSGLTGVVRALSTPPVDVDWSSIAQAYGLAPTTTLVSGFASQFATAELLIHAGTSVIIVSAGGPGCTLGWDTHSDGDGVCARAGFNDVLLPSLKTFLRRTIDLPGHNVVTALVGDFTRAVGGEHASMLVASAWGKHLRPGSTGRFDIVGGYNSYVPKDGQRHGVPQLWSFLGAAAGATQTPFGANPHPFVG